MSEAGQAGPAGGSSAMDDPSIPVLTERIFLPAAGADAVRAAACLPPAPHGEAAMASRPDTEPHVPSAAPTQEPQQSVAQDQTAGATVAADDAAVEAQPGEQAERPIEAVVAAVPDTAEAAATQGAWVDDLRAAVLQRVAERLPDQVDATVRDLMQPAIDKAITQLSEEAQLAMRIALQDLIEQVLREEIARREGTRPQ
jgi:hypothetical protein